MKTNLTKWIGAAGCFLLAGLALPAKATHWQGSELTYMCVAPYIYVVELKLFRDCYGVQAPQNAHLQIKSPGCNNGRSFSLARAGNPVLGTDYCAQLITPTCTATGSPNYEAITYTGVVTFSAAEAQCPDWVLSWSEASWPNISNFSNSQGINQYAEAHLKLGIPGTTAAPLINSSPQLITHIPRYLNQNQSTMLSNLAIDSDGDSLVYSLVPILQNANTPVQYTGFNPPNGMIFNPQDSTQYAIVAPADRAYSATFPMPSYFVDWTQPAPRAATKSFVIDSQNGSLLFITPPMTSTNIHSPADKYAVAVQVDEYRTINGTAVKIGSVRRSIMFTIIDCGPNNNPLLTAPTANGQVLTPGSVINLRPGTPLNFTFASHDDNVNDVLTLESDAADLLPGATFSKTSGNRPTGTITWTPTAADARNQLYFFRIFVQDDACPVKGQRVETFGVRVSNAGGVTSTTKELTTQPGFTAYPNPFGSSLTFRVKQTQPNQQILIYNVLGQQIDQIVLKGQLQTEQEVTWTNAAKFPAGQYVARFNNGSGQSLKINKLQ